MRGFLYRHNKAASTFLAFSLMFLSFNFNLFNAVNPDKFYDFQSDSESLVIGRLIKSREDGIFSSQGRMGRYLGLPGDYNRNQEGMYFHKTIDGEYVEYNSQIGLQGILYSYLDGFFSGFGLNPSTRYAIYHTINSCLLAGALSLFLFLIYSEIGLKACAFVLFVIVFSRWLVYFGKNFYWMISFAFFPMLAVYTFCKLEELGKKTYFLPLYVVIFFLISIKSGMGYEYISTIMLASLTPLIFFATKNRWPRRKLAKRIINIGIYSLAGFFLAVSVHIYQLTAATGETNSAVNIIMERVLARTQTDPEAYRGTVYYESQATPALIVLYEYLIKGGSHRFKIPYLYWILLFLLVTYKYKHAIKNFQHTEEEQRLIKALIITTWFSILAPLSWIILAKSHSQIHTQINYIVWQIPFLLFGCALTGKYLAQHSRLFNARLKFLT